MKTNKKSSESLLKEVNKTYTKDSGFWDRTEKKIQSDFLCRDPLFKMVGNIKGKKLLDIGCGEGYVPRKFAQMGAKVTGLEYSDGLVKTATEREKEQKLGIVYVQGDARKMKLGSKIFDIATSVLVYGHFDKKGINKASQEAARVLKRGGEYYLAVPHPFMYPARPKTEWYQFNYETNDYWRENNPITLRTKDMEEFDINAQNHTVGDYFSSLIQSGFIVEKIEEPRPTTKDLKNYSKMWGEENKIPFYLLIKARKNSN